MLTVRAMTGGQGYAQRHLEHSDYYDQSRTVRGEWYGRGAELLGLRGEVTLEQFESIQQGLHPDTGDFLRPRHSADRLGVNGDVESKARSLYDLTFSAPKSISVQAFVGGDERLLEAHRIAVNEALGEAERHAGARVRLGGANHDRQTGNLIVASYTIAVNPASARRMVRRSRFKASIKTESGWKMGERFHLTITSSHMAMR